MRTRRRRRRSKSAAIYVTVGVLLILITAILGISVFLKIMDIEVVGSTMYPEKEVIMASGISPGNNMLFFDKETAARRIRTAMPYISEVSIELVPPATVRITVSESTAIAKIAFMGKLLLIDSAGRVLKQADATNEDMIEVRGFVPSEAEVGNKLRAPAGSETQLRSMIDVLTAFEKEGILGSIAYLDVTNIAAISFGYTGRFTVILGGSGNAGYKLSQLPGIVSDIDEERTENARGIINMSDASGKWRFNPDW